MGDVCFGSVMGPSSQRANECRIAMFLAGFPESVPVHTVNRQCSSGKQAVGGWVGGASRVVESGKESAGWLAGWTSAGWGASARCTLPQDACQSANPTLCPVAAPPPSASTTAGLQAIAQVAASIRAGFYTVGIAGGVESMTTNPMAWEGAINPRVAESQCAQDCLLPMGGWGGRWWGWVGWGGGGGRFPSGVLKRKHQGCPGWAG